MRSAGGRRTLLGVATFLAVAVIALILPAALHAGRPDPATAFGPTAFPPVSPPVSSPTFTQPYAPGSSTPPATHPGPLRTSCSSLLYVGDSTSEGVVSIDYLPEPSDREDARLRAVGVRTFIPEISGARAIVEHYKGQASGADVVNRYVAQGYRGCWIIALGNNDAANMSVGGTPDAAGRIDMVMRRIGGQKVLWVDTRTLVSTGPNAEPKMAAWDSALLGACGRYPELRVYDWASEVRPDWYTHTDDIHYTTPGYRARSLGIARALANAFPASGAPQPGCTVTSR
ncbi:SGNH/GDSL hydrolase family protein [Allobranchiibius sp. GilTou73]|uniref:SGNH/GDSL hydrolase family protein n=1 Tax=Allobranchiibius sp. GilTou73 TaxID=2904523 RepID=UPI001F1B6025|nr:SGNH/GDSL hydrolase family protein [Allobranchiibius sp. GilTou73]UIJ34024.1 SGNH/GDSL hydrolase family protein [Allobranchiibius sp. GilTou73]